MSVKNLLFLLIALLPAQIGRHFWPPWTQVLGLRIDYLSPTLYLTDLILLLLFLTSLPSIISFLKRQNFLFFGAGGLVLLLLGIGIVNSRNPDVGIYQLIKWLGFVFFGFILAQKVVSHALLRQITLILSGGVILESLLALAQFLNQGSIGGIFWWLGERTFSGQTPGIAQAVIDGQLVLRPYGTFSHPNVLAGYLVVVLALILGFSYQARWQQSIRWLAIILGVLALFFTFSRSAWTAGLLVILFYFVTRKQWLPLTLVILLSIAGASSIQSRFATLFLSDQESLEQRQELNLAALEMIQTHPAFGVGLENFLVELPRYHQERRAVRFIQPAHNFYLMIAAELGIPALLAFLGFLFLTYCRLIKQFSSPLLIALSVILILSIFDHYFYTLQQGQLLLAMILGLSWVKRG